MHIWVSTLICSLSLLFLPGQVTAEIPRDSVKTNKSLKVGVVLSTNLNYLKNDFGGVNQITSDYKFGGAASLYFDWKIRKIYHLGFSIYYAYRPAANDYEDDLNKTSVLFQNHHAGILFTPIVLQLPYKVSPKLSAGIMYEFIFSSKTEVFINDRPFSNVDLKVNPSQYGVHTAIGIYISRIFIEMRYKLFISDYINTESENTHLHAIEFGVGF